MAFAQNSSVAVGPSANRTMADRARLPPARRNWRPRQITIPVAYTATPALATTTDARSSPSQAKTIEGARASKTTLKLVDTTARWRIRIAGGHDPPGGTRLAVTAVNPATATAIAAIPSRSGSPGMARSL